MIGHPLIDGQGKLGLLQHLFSGDAGADVAIGANLRLPGQHPGVVVLQQPRVGENFRHVLRNHADARLLQQLLGIAHGAEGGNPGA